MNQSSWRNTAPDFGPQDAALAGSLAADRGSRMAALEHVLNLLLHHLAGHHSLRPTDGVVSLHEELTPHRYFLIAKVFMIADQVAEPVCVSLARNKPDSIADGHIFFGLLNGQLPKGINSREKLESVLLAYPHDATEAVPWALRFVRATGQWQLT